MKRIALVTSIFCAALVLGCESTAPPPVYEPASGVGTARPTMQQVSAKEGFARLVARYDKNGDGLLQLSELPPRLGRTLRTADTNHDGVLSQDELQAFGFKLARQRFDALDTNNDGALSQAEAGSIWPRIRVADTNHDGKVTWDEFKTAHEEGKLRPVQ